MDVPKLFSLWADGMRMSDIATEFGVSTSTVERWKSRYHLPARARASQPVTRDPTPAEIETMKRELREKHLAERRGEP